MSINKKLILLIIFSLLASSVISLVAISAISDLGVSEDAKSEVTSHLIITTIIVACILAVVGFIVSRLIVHPLSTLENTIKHTIDELDFSETVPVKSDDEVGRILESYNQLIVRLRDSFSQIQQSAGQLIDVSEQVEQSSKRITRNTKLQSDASNNMAAAVEEMTVSISVVSKQATAANMHTEDSRGKAEHSSNVILETVSGIQQISDLVQEAASRIKALREDSESISDVANIINDIAGQTNLLALNAAIEAARAGEQGRGFSVVADEVRQLAERTAKSTQEINVLLAQMQDSAKLAVDSMDATERAVSDGVLRAREAGDSIKTIKEGSNAAAHEVAEISTAIGEQESASTEIAKHIDHIARLGEQNSQSIEASIGAMHRLSQISHQLSDSMVSYKVSSDQHQHLRLRVADILGDDFPSVKALHSMAETLEKRTNGKIGLKVFSNGSFGTEADALEQVKEGILDMARVNISQLNKSCPETVVPTLPFLFESSTHMHKAVDSEAGEFLTQACNQDGLMCLGLYDSGSRSFYCDKPIRSLDDAKGMSFRVPQSDLWVAVIEAMGGYAKPLSLDEVVAGMQTGLIDGAENTIQAYLGFNHYQIFSHFSKTEHSIAPDILVFSSKRWDSLKPGEQEIIQKAADESVRLSRQFATESERTCLDKLKREGAQFVTDVDKRSFQRAMNNVYSKFVKTDGQKKLLRLIQNLR